MSQFSLWLRVKCQELSTYSGRIANFITNSLFPAPNPELHHAKNSKGYLLGKFNVTKRHIAIAISTLAAVGVILYKMKKRKSSLEHAESAETKILRLVELKDYGYKFNEDGQLVSIEDESEGFNFNYYTNPDDNQRRYQEIGKLVDEYVYSELEKVCDPKLERLPVPKEGALDWSDSTFIFASKGYKVKDKLMVLIHGAGVVRAGQWSRRLIINEGMESGSQIPYIKRALDAGYGVLVLNTNDNSRNGRSIKKSEDPESHAIYVWENYISETNAKYIAIVAHSYGGYVTSALIQSCKPDFKERVFAVAYTDAMIGSCPSDFKRRFHKIGRNWVRSYKPLGTPVSESGFPLVSAGTEVHEETSHKAINEVFKFIEHRLKEQMEEEETYVKKTMNHELQNVKSYIPQGSTQNISSTAAPLDEAEENGISSISSFVVIDSLAASSVTPCGSAGTSKMDETCHSTTDATAVLSQEPLSDKVKEETTSKLATNVGELTNIEMSDAKPDIETRPQEPLNEPAPSEPQKEAEGDLNSGLSFEMLNSSDFTSMTASMNAHEKTIPDVTNPTTEPAAESVSEGASSAQEEFYDEEKDRMAAASLHTKAE